MTTSPKKQRFSARKLLPPLIVGSLGTAIVILYSMLVPRTQLLDVALLLVVVAYATLGSRQNTIRGIMSGLALYIASGIAAAFYRQLAPYTDAFLQTLSLSLPPSDTVTVGYNSLAFSFGFLVLVVWGALEAIGRVSLQDTSLPKLGFLDTLGGILVYLIVGILIAALLFNIIGYSQVGWYAHQQSRLRPRFNRVLYLHYKAQAFWFGQPPPIYTYDLNL